MLYLGLILVKQGTLGVLVGRDCNLFVHITAVQAVGLALLVCLRG